jgi:Na+/melibiose symporter-like transporter
MNTPHARRMMFREKAVWMMVFGRAMCWKLSKTGINVEQTAHTPTITPSAQKLLGFSRWQACIQSNADLVTAFELMMNTI